MEKRKKITHLFFFLIFMISCSSDYKYEYKSEKDHKNSFIIKTSDDRNRMVISMVYQNQIEDNLYYLRVNNEFYQCDKTFAENSIVEPVQFSTKEEYRFPSKFKIDKLIIEKEGNYYVTINNMTDYSGTISLRYFYDKDYKIIKIITNNKTYTIQ